MNSIPCETLEKRNDQWNENNLSNGGLIITFKTEKESDESEDENEHSFEDEANDLSEYLEYSQTDENLGENHETSSKVQANGALNITIKEEPLDDKPEVLLPDLLENREVTQTKIKEEPDTDCLCEREFVACDTENYKCEEKGAAIDQPGLLYECDTCKANFNSKWDLENHVEKCSEETALKNAVKARFKAKLGLSGFTAPLELRHQMKEKEVPKKTNPAIHGNCKPSLGKKYSCNLCGASFKCRSNVKVHTALKHSTDRKFECHICHAKFKIKYILKKHINIKHSDVRNFSCLQCDAKFKTKFEVVSHTRFKHTDERNFECPICNARFKTKAHLQAHESNTHSKTRNFRCNVCSATFKSKTALNRHLKYNSSKLHSNVLVFECTSCNMTFKAELPLKLHMAMSHSKDKTGS